MTIVGEIDESTLLGYFLCKGVDGKKEAGP